MKIGDLAEQTGASPRSLRYYEEQGLLTSERTMSGQRRYPPDAVDRVRLLRQLYNASLTSNTITTLLPCVDSPSAAVTAEAITVMKHEHARLGQQITDLATTQQHLAFLIQAAATAKTCAASG